MKKIVLKLSVVFTAILFSGACIQDNVDSSAIDEPEKRPKRLEDIITRSNIEQPDSLTMLNIMQSDVDNLMINRVTFRDGSYVLTIKREDALFLGVSEEVYDNYVDYVDKLNKGLNE